MLAALVKAGKLPPVNQRLPDKPVVVEPVNEIGQYGGTWRRVIVHEDMLQLHASMGYEPLVRWDRSGKQVIPGVAERWEVLDGGRTYRFHLRRNIKWSDGHPFTSDDFVFWYEDFATDTDLLPILPAYMNRGGIPLSISAPDQYTVDFHSPKPHALLLEVLCFRGHYVYLPKHYMMQFHQRYADPDALAREVKQRGYNLWNDLFIDMRNYNRNPDLPTIRPFQLKNSPPATRVIVERNPYYWKVDPAGNQLPYIDRIACTFVQNDKIVNLKAMTGEVDMQAPYLDSANYTLFMENRDKGGYRILVDPANKMFCLYVNQHSKDEQMRPILKDRRFRVALSIGINREELIKFMFGGLAEPARGVASPLDPYYQPWFDKKYVEYDPAEANRLLDEVGLKRNKRGMRMRPDGTPFRQILNVYPSEAGAMLEMWQLVADYWRELGLDFHLKSAARDLSLLQVRNGNTNFWANTRKTMHWAIQPLLHIPVGESSYFAPQYGRYNATHGRGGVKPPAEFQNLSDWYQQMITSYGDPQRKLELGTRILEQWANECYTIDIARTKQLTLVSNRFKNMPDSVIQSFQVMPPGYIGTEQFYLDPAD